MQKETKNEPNQVVSIPDDLLTRSLIKKVRMVFCQVPPNNYIWTNPTFLCGGIWFVYQEYCTNIIMIKSNVPKDPVYIMSPYLHGTHSKRVFISVATAVYSF